MDASGKVERTVGEQLDDERHERHFISLVLSAVVAALLVWRFVAEGGWTVSVATVFALIGVAWSVASWRRPRRPS